MQFHKGKRIMDFKTSLIRLTVVSTLGFIFMVLLFITTVFHKELSRGIQLLFNFSPEGYAISAIGYVGGSCNRIEDIMEYGHPKWLDEIKGDPIVGVDLSDKAGRVSNSNLLHLSQLTELRTLNLRRAFIPD